MKQKINNITLGADPELFLQDSDSRKIISAVGLIGGTKNNPLPISDEGHAIQEDNVAIEYNIPPCATKEEWVNAHNFVKDYLEVVTLGINGVLNLSASAYLDEEQLQTPQAKAFGCEPDFNVYLKNMNEPPSSDTNLRVCGGHIAVGFDKSNLTTVESDEIVEDLIKAMDITLGLRSVLLDPDTERRKMYGKAGCFRFKDFGLEYRTLSNFWIKDNETLSWAWDCTQEAIRLVNSNLITNICEKYSTKVVEAINTNNKILAEQLLEDIFEKELQLV